MPNPKILWPALTGNEPPSQHIMAWREDGTLARLLPEINNLFGVPAGPLEHHPEKDAGIHTMMVVDQAWRLSAHLSSVQAFRVVLAALFHDVGKGLTKPRYWPSHHGHEQAGVEPVREICSRLGLDGETTAFACLATGAHGLVHISGSLTPQRLVHLLVDDIGAVEHPHRFDLLMLVCEADARGRTGFEDRSYEQPEALQEILTAIREIGASPNPQDMLKDRVGAVKRARREIRERAEQNHSCAAGVSPW